MYELIIPAEHTVEIAQQEEGNPIPNSPFSLFNGSLERHNEGEWVERLIFSMRKQCLRLLHYAPEEGWEGGASRDALSRPTQQHIQSAPFRCFLLEECKGVHFEQEEHAVRREKWWEDMLLRLKYLLRLESDQKLDWRYELSYLEVGNTPGIDMDLSYRRMWDRFEQGTYSDMLQLLDLGLPFYEFERQVEERNLHP